ncbi:16670_t:CDS:2, partial [Gigaspora rosea]
DKVEKGDEISYFQFGGSDYILVFEKESEIAIAHSKPIASAIEVTPVPHELGKYCSRLSPESTSAS